MMPLFHARLSIETNERYTKRFVRHALMNLLVRALIQLYGWKIRILELETQNGDEEETIPSDYP